ncbi:hypothetical protein SETIT_9G561600v2 [Setaria italica]|uniref:Uncharacterized protein n=1 Tax=Setaria italica TaxID=4555 RepID=A0A368SWQ1_SETIT|nr:hypothetical protein SETIT_9G561600v2 [Setaria italica]
MPLVAACSPAPPHQLDNEEEGSGRRQVLLAGAAAAAAFISRPNPAAFAAEAKKGFLPVVDKKAGARRRLEERKSRLGLREKGAHRTDEDPRTNLKHRKPRNVWASGRHIGLAVAALRELV